MSDLNLRPDHDPVAERDVHPVIQMPLDDPPARTLVELLKRAAVVRAESGVRIGRGAAAHPQPIRRREADSIGQVVFPLRILTGQAGQRIPQEFGTEPISARIDLFYLKLFRGGILLLDDREHPSILPPQDPPVAGRVLQLCGHQRHRAPLRQVFRICRIDRLRRDERRVPVEHQKVAPLCKRLGRHHHRMAGPAALRLPEKTAARGNGLFKQVLLVACYDIEFVNARCVAGILHPAEHRLEEHLAEHLRTVGPHPFPVPCRENDREPASVLLFHGTSPLYADGFAAGFFSANNREPKEPFASSIMSIFFRVCKGLDGNFAACRKFFAGLPDGGGKSPKNLLFFSWK